MNFSNKPLTKQRQIELLSSIWTLTPEQLEACDCVRYFYKLYPNINPAQLALAFNVQFVPVPDRKAPQSYAQLLLPTNGRKVIAQPRKPIEHAETLILFRKHISGKWIAMFLPVWDYHPALADDIVTAIDIPALVRYNASLKLQFTNRETV
jgi:hypothetical protein